MTVQPELRLLLEQHRTLEQPRFTTGLAGTLAVHALLAVLALTVPMPAPPRVEAPRIVADLQRTPLVAPPRQLTQRDPNTGRISQEVNLPGLLARRSPVPLPPSPPAPTRPAAPRTVDTPPAPAVEPPKPQPLPEPPKIDPPANVDVAANLNKPPAGSEPAPPRIEPVEKPPAKPKLAFESVDAQSVSGAGRASAGGRSILETPRPASVEDAAREMARRGGGGLAVGDIGAGAGGLGEALSGSSGVRQASSLELLSDPAGVDFKPYLIQILSTIRRNWLAVLPESARLGRRGKVQIQFAVDRTGAIPKLVIAQPSGTEAFDRAAVAGISASNPLPPLPREFRGEQVRLQFTFLYNIPTR
jgi:TonB family protein